MRFFETIWKRVLSAARGPLGKYSIMLFMAQRIGDFSMLATKFILGRYLPNLDFGAFDPFLSILAIVGLPVFIISQTAIKTISRLDATDQPAKRATFIRDLTLVVACGGLLSAAGVYFLRDYIFLRLHLDASGSLLFIMVGLTLLTWAIPLITAILQGGQKYTTLAIMSSTSPILVMVVTLGIMAVHPLQIEDALGARVWAGLATFGIFFALHAVRQIKGERASYREELRPLLSTVLPMTVFLGCFVAMVHFDRLFVRNFMIEDSGGYGAVITLGQIPLWISGPITWVLFPMASAEHAVGKDLTSRVRQMVIGGTVLTVSTTLIAFLIAGPVFRLWNPAFSPYAPYVWQYTLALGLESVIQLLGSIEIARHRYASFWWMSLVTVVYGALVYTSKSWISLPQLMICLIAARVLIVGGLLVSTRCGHASVATEKQ